MRNVVWWLRAIGMGIAMWALLTTGHTQSIDGNCMQFNPNGNMHCDFSRPELSDWVYATGYGATASTEQQSAQNTIDFLYPDRSNMCSFNYSLGASKVEIRDSFIDSNAPIRTSRDLEISWTVRSADGSCTGGIGSGGATIWGVRVADCKPGWMSNWDAARAVSFCAIYASPNPPSPPICRAGPSSGSSQPDGAQVANPIIPATGDKVQMEVDYAGFGPAALSFTRIYRSLWVNGKAQIHAPSGLGKGWSHNHLTRLQQFGTTINLVTVTTGEGYVRHFNKATSSNAWAATNSADRLTRTSTGWIYRRAEDDAILTFNAAGRLVTDMARNGWATGYTYNNAGQLASISNSFGRSLTLTYDGAGRLATVADGGGRVIGYAYDGSGRLVGVSYPDGNTRGYIYENATFASALTGIVDEGGARYATYTYGADGDATVSEHAGVERYEISRSSDSAVVKDPLGTQRTYGYARTYGQLVVTSGSLPSAMGNDDANARLQDANGLVTNEYDFKWMRLTITWDTARRLPLTVTRAVGTPEAQTVTTQWHATFALPVLVTEAGRSVAYTYDAQGNTLSEAITDTLVNPNTTKTRSWTYNPQGLVATETASNGGVTSYTYDTSGNVLSATRPLGHVTTTSYDSANRVLTQTAPNGLVTTYTWDARDRLLTQTVGGQQTTTLTYNPTGTLATLALPTGLVLSYSYDAAHRLTGWTNNRGESASFTLDAMGNRTAEQIKNSAGNVAWAAAKSVNAINRVASASQGQGAAAQSSSFGYDANGERTQSTNGLNQSTRLGLDGLRRVSTVTDPANASATLSYNALDAVTAAKDFKGVTTSYGRDAKGNATVESSADAGQHVSAYDSLGLPQTVVDALGQSTTVTHDLLGRPTQLSFVDGKTTTLSYGTSGVGKGYLTSLADRSGSTVYTRDAFGRIAIKKQTLASGAVQQVLYTHRASGLADSVSYPGGALLQYVYDTTGRLTGMNWNAQPLITDISWNPLGQPLGWKWAFGNTSATPLTASRSYDTAGRMTATEFSSYQYDAAGRITGLTQSLYQPADTVNTNSTVSSANTSWTVGYDAVGRITAFNVVTPASPANTAGFSYDANGNRQTSARVLGSQTTARTYALPTGGNRASGFSQTVGSTTSSVSYGYNANGDLVSDGLNAFSHNAEGRLSNATVGHSDSSPTTRYAHNALGQRVFKTAPLFPVLGTMGTDLDAFFAKGWTPATTTAELTGTTYTYDEDGTLIAESSSNPSAPGITLYIALPTASGPMPIAAVINGAHYAVSSDHLNTPRRLMSESGQVMWQWAYSAFGETAPTTAAKRFAGPDTIPTTGMTTAMPVTFNLRYPGQYADSESGLFYNYFRSYNATTGRYSQPDPIGRDGGWNRFGYVEGNPLSFTDALGLQSDRRPRRPNMPNWLQPPQQPNGSCATAECAAGLLPTIKENPTACEMQCGIGSNDASGRALACAAISQMGKLAGLPGIPVTLACKAIDKHACVKSCEEKRQCN